MMLLKILGLVLAINGSTPPLQHQSLLSGLADAAQSDKGLILYFKSDACTACPPWEAFLEREDIKTAMESDFVQVDVNIDDFDGKACSEIYDVSEAPALVIVDKEGAVLYKDETSLREHAFIQFLQNPKNNARAKRMDSNEAPQLVPQPKPASEKPSFATGYYVQTGYFGSMENATRMVQMLKEQGFSPVGMKKEEKDGRHFYRVLIGPFPDEARADQILRQCLSKEISAKLYIAD